MTTENEIDSPLSAAEQQAVIAVLAQWSPWQAPVVEAVMHAPKRPGVYLFRDPGSKDIVYVGMSRAAKGLWGRLGVYRIGKGASGGFGEYAMDRALADPKFLAKQLKRAKAGNPVRAKEWAIDAINSWGPEVCWTECESRDEAKDLEKDVIKALERGRLLNLGPGRRR